MCALAARGRPDTPAIGQPAEIVAPWFAHHEGGGGLIGQPAEIVAPWLAARGPRIHTKEGASLAGMLLASRASSFSARRSGMLLASRAARSF